ncbi:hypothetical protein EU805_01475 [Salipiger sp. IMCC34102]|uniref:L,D-transpeptidase family protein n=1 Tax=Salipiger sp. IMCC34102 TaxID=2510647 RepID=UPI00101D0E8E|nr:L,D-transpeptidase family protein [Salipiger sp. IMCC34102]RYH04070.1 hypothetical protein EU805_01475 [Salipiger sp. IMCC34102]
MTPGGPPGGPSLRDTAKPGPWDLVLTPTHLRFAGLRFPCTIGRGGLTSTKREGDGATPRGVHAIVGAYYRPDRMTRPVAWAQPIGPRDLWSDDPRDPAYNTHVTAPHPFGHESLRRADPMYDLVLVADWNWPDAVPGKGSAIFIHQWRGPGRPTAGCVALRRDHLRAITARLKTYSRLVIA